MSLHIAILDDEIECGNELKEKISSMYDNAYVEVFSNSLDLLSQHSHFDILFLDIYMPDVDGIKLSKEITGMVDLIIFVTSDATRVYEAFGHNVFGYILKDEIDKTIKQVMDRVIQELSNRKITFPIKNGAVVLNKKEIECIRIENRKMYVYCTNTHYRILNVKLNEVIQELGSSFIYVDRSCIVNIDAIYKIENHFLTLNNGMNVEISRKKVKDIKQQILRRI